MAKKRRRKKQEEHIHEDWLIPYADILTLLLALFIVLFASSQVDITKLQQFSKAFNVHQGSEGVMDFPTPVDTDSENTDLPKNDGQNGEEKPPEQTPENPVEKENASNEKDEEYDAYQSEMQSLQELKDEFDKYIMENKLDKSLQTVLNEDGLLIIILDNALFDSGSAVVKSDAMKMAKEISKLLDTEKPRSISIGGHTDNVPINNSNYESNWDLSADRALNFMKVLLQNTNLEPERFSSTGYGEYRPVASNSTESGKAKNRRVEVLILPNYEVTK